MKTYRFLFPLAAMLPMISLLISLFGLLFLREYYLHDSDLLSDAEKMPQVRGLLQAYTMLLWGLVLLTVIYLISLIFYDNCLHRNELSKKFTRVTSSLYLLSAAACLLGGWIPIVCGLIAGCRILYARSRYFVLENGKN